MKKNIYILHSSIRKQKIHRFDLYFGILESLLAINGRYSYILAMTTAIKTSNKTVSVNKEEYEALIQTARVTSEYLEGKVETFDSAESLIRNLKSL